MNILAPSILSADMAHLGDDIKKLEEAGVSCLHFDVMDGSFVPSISFGMPVVKAVRAATDMTIDLHMMVSEPERYIEEFAELGADIITIHAEACVHLGRTLRAIRQMGKKAGVALNPATPLTMLEYILDYVDVILIMSVDPGFGGQKFLKTSTQKIKDTYALLKKHGLEDKVTIEVDGGICQENVKEVVDAGASMIVMGTAVFKGDIKENVKSYDHIFKV